MCSPCIYVHRHSVHVLLYSEHTENMSTYERTTDCLSCSLQRQAKLFPLTKLYEAALMCTCYGLRILLSNVNLTGPRLLIAASKLLIGFVKQ